MKLTAIIPLLTLTSTTLALPTLPRSKRQMGPSQQDTITAIKNWNNDVNIVNNFLNAAPNQAPTDAQRSAALTLPLAQDEPKELAVLSSIEALADDATNAISDLMNVFVMVPMALQSIIDGGDIEMNVNTINQVRCCNVLPDLDVLWQAAATSEGVADQVNLVVARPNACGTITC